MSLIKPATSKLVLKNHAILYTAVRNHWNKDYKPGPFPKTPEERAAVAKKYEIFPEDYKPYPDNGNGLGDYPNIPMESGDFKDPTYPWDNPELKRNFGEPIHADADMIGEDRYDVNFRHRVPLWKQLIQFTCVVGGTFIVFHWLQDKKMFLAVAEKQYPKAGKTYYTFEPNN